MKPIEFHSEAWAELDEAIGYYERKVPGLGIDLREAVEIASKEIQANPLRFRPFSKKIRCFLLVRFPYQLVFVELPNKILIVAVAHGNGGRVIGMDASNSQPTPVWVTGSGGLIGNYLVQTARRFHPSWCVRDLTRAELDLTDFVAVRQAFQTDSPRLVIHCAALANTPACEKNPALARKLNVEVTAALAELAADIPFIFFSTDLVFDGLAGNYDESAAVNPLSVYAQTKVEAERIVLANPKHTALRTSLNFGKSPSGDRAFNEQMRHALERGETLKLFTDEFRCPIPAVETARVVWELAAQNKPGLYHVAGAERLSRWEIGVLLAKHWAYPEPKLEPGSLKDFRGLPRSPDTSLNCAKIQKLLSAPLPRFSEWLAKNEI